MNLLGKIKKLLLYGRNVFILLRDNGFIYTSRQISGKAWIESKPDLSEYNKTIITLSSSTLVLSFTVIQLAKLKINKPLLIISWGFFLLVIMIGLLLLFLNFIHSLMHEVINLNSSYKKYKDNLDFASSKDAKIYFGTRKYMFYLSITELFFFWCGLVLLITEAIIVL